MPESITPREAGAEFLFFAAVGAAYVIGEGAGVAKRWSFSGLAAALVVYALWIWHRGKETRGEFGIRADNFVPSAKAIAPWTAGAIVAIIAWAIATHSRIWRAELAVLLPLYPVFGVAQQLLFQGVLHRRLRVVVKSSWAAALLTAAAFALVHWGNPALMGLAFVWGLVCSLVFVRCQNVLTLGIAHGVLAALVYPLILGENPITRI